MRISRICKCGKIVKGQCEECSKKQSVLKEQFRTSPTERGYDHAWRKLSERFRSHNPLCANCNSNGRVTIAQDVHHIKPIRSNPELRLEWDNLMSLCRPCHKMIEDQTNG